MKRRKQYGPGVPFKDILRSEKGGFCVVHDGDFMMCDGVYNMPEGGALNIAKQIWTAGRNKRDDLPERATVRRKEITRLIGSTYVTPLRIH